MGSRVCVFTHVTKPLALPTLKNTPVLHLILRNRILRWPLAVSMTSKDLVARPSDIWYLAKNFRRKLTTIRLIYTVKRNLSISRSKQLRITSSRTSLKGSIDCKKRKCSANWHHPNLISLPKSKNWQTSKCDARRTVLNGHHCLSWRMT